MIIFAYGIFTVDCGQTVGRTDFGRTLLEPALKGQYKIFIDKNGLWINMQKKSTS